MLDPTETQARTLLRSVWGLSVTPLLPMEMLYIIVKWQNKYVHMVLFFQRKSKSVGRLAF